MRVESVASCCVDAFSKLMQRIGIYGVDMSTDSTSSNNYRWIIVGCSFLVLFLSQGMTLGGVTVFDEKILAHLSEVAGRPIPLSEFKGGLAVMFLAAALFGILAGWLCDKVGPRVLILAGLALLGVGNFLYSDVNTLQDVYMISALYGLVLVLCGLMIRDTR